MPDGKTSFDLKLTPVAADKTNIYVIDTDTNGKTLVGEKDNYTYTVSIDNDELIKTFIIRGEFREGDGAAAEYTLTLKRPNAPDGATLLYTADDLVALRDRVNSGDACVRVSILNLPRTSPFRRTGSLWAACWNWTPTQRRWAIRSANMYILSPAALTATTRP